MDYSKQGTYHEPTTLSKEELSKKYPELDANVRKMDENIGEMVKLVVNILNIEPGEKPFGPKLSRTKMELIVNIIGESSDPIDSNPGRNVEGEIIDSGEKIARTIYRDEVEDLTPISKAA